MTRMLKGEVPARFFLLSIAYLHITCSLGIQPMVHTIPTALVVYGTHLSIVSCIIVKNCPVIQKNASSSSPRLHMKTQLAICTRFHFQCSPELCGTPEIKRSVSSIR